VQCLVSFNWLRVWSAGDWEDVLLAAAIHRSSAGADGRLRLYFKKGSAYSIWNRPDTFCDFFTFRSYRVKSNNWQTSTMESTTYQADALPASPLLRLPFEIRLMIYEYLLLPSTTPTTGNGTSVANLIPDFHTYLSDDTNNDACTLSVRTMDPWLGSQGPKTWRRRSTYHIRTGTFTHTWGKPRRTV